MQESVLRVSSALCAIHRTIWLGDRVCNADPERVHHLLEIETVTHPRVEFRVFRPELRHGVISLLIHP